ncbi:hypothetical protein G9C98_002644, partial [Cotesia typhae]
MAIPFNLPSEDEADAQSQQLEQLMLDLYAALQQVLRSRSAQHPSRNHRLPRRGGETGASRDHPIVLIDSDLSRLPLPDLVLTAVQQLPSPEPQVTVSAPSSPTRDAAFQFPECSAPVPSPRPRPRRRRLTSESSVLEKGATSRSDSISTACCRHLGHSCNEREWASVGANLRNIADDFHASKNKLSVNVNPGASARDTLDNSGSVPGLEIGLPFAIEFAKLYEIAMTTMILMMMMMMMMMMTVMLMDISIIQLESLTPEST